jgi:hypothetical protein
MPFHDLNSDERGSDEIRWTAGGRSEVTVIVGGERVFRGELQKAERVIVAYEDAEKAEKEDR